MKNDQMQVLVDKMKEAFPGLPDVKFNRNGYEIRTKVLEMAQTQAWQDYYAKFAGYETSVTKEGDEIVTKVEMPTIPGAEDVLEVAKKFYSFVDDKGK